MLYFINRKSYRDNIEIGGGEGNRRDARWHQKILNMISNLIFVLLHVGFSLTPASGKCVTRSLRKLINMHRKQISTKLVSN